MRIQDSLYIGKVRLGGVEHFSGLSRLSFEKSVPGLK